ncbi:MAG: hypothetical protein PHW00_01820 [Clostridia bacterium]|nr:hypothetical protein [Clostridia bacterium]
MKKRRKLLGTVLAIILLLSSTGLCSIGTAYAEEIYRDVYTVGAGMTESAIRSATNTYDYVNDRRIR